MSWVEAPWVALAMAMALPPSLGLASLFYPPAGELSAMIISFYIPYSLGVILLAAYASLHTLAIENERDAAVLGVIIGLISASRVPFAAIPGFQPCTAMIFITGQKLGWRKGIFVGMMVPVVSNLFLGHGPWTLWQMGAWALAGFIGGMFHDRDPGKLAPMVMLILGFAYGWIVDISTAIFMRTYILAVIASFPFDLLHAIGNVIFYALLKDVYGTELSAVAERTKVEFVT